MRLYSPDRKSEKQGVENFKTLKIRVIIILSWWKLLRKNFWMPVISRFGISYLYFIDFLDQVDNKKMFYVSGTASEEKDVVFPSSATVSETPPANNKDVKKHNIGFNIMMPDDRQATPSPKFKVNIN